MPTVPAPVFADLVLKETVVQAASLFHGLRRALAPETRNRIRFQMRQEVKRSRKQRRTELREARREWAARQRAAMAAERERRMNRGLWFVAGAGAGIYAMIRGRRAAEALTVDGLQDRLNGLAVGVADVPRRGRPGQGREAKPSCASGFALAPHGDQSSTTGTHRRQAPPEEEGSS